MIQKWFVNDINEVLGQQGRVVVTDANSEGKFLLDFLPQTVVLLEVGDSELDEIKAKYEAEARHAQDPVVFYLHRSKESLTFLLEYAETQGCIVLDDMESYIRKHLFADMHLNTELNKQELLLAAKLSRGKDQNWWKAVCMRAIQPLDRDQLVLDLLISPKQTAEEMDKEVWQIFCQEVYVLIGKPQTEQPAEVMAQAVMDALFEGLLYNHISDSLLTIYNRCVSSHQMDEKMADYIKGFTLPKDANPLDAHPDHPFKALDEKLMRSMSHALENGEFLTNYVHFIEVRTQGKLASTYKATWLADVKTVVEYKNENLYQVNSLETFAAYYRDHFTQLDTAIRHLYAAWLHEEAVLRPFQFYYEQQEKELLGKWFALTADYQPTQRNLLSKKFSDSGRIAILVCDGLRLEMAESIYQHAKSKKKNEYAFAMLPSVTENGMSALFGCEGVELNAQKRYAHLGAEDADLQVMQAEKLNSGVTARHLVLMLGDIDQVGEEKQLAALEDINGYEKKIADKIETLLSMGYHKVYITADHGYVITGILDEADKIEVPQGDIGKVDERFCLANARLSDRKGLVEREDEFCGSAYQYYAISDKPFKTKGAYGYAHGGFTPQECIIPIYEFGQDAAAEALHVSIANKKDLLAVAGQYFKLKLQAESSADMFEQERRMEIHFFEGSKELQIQIVTIKQGQLVDNNEFVMPPSGKAKVVLVDASTKEQIDYCEVKSSSARDLDDLF